MLFKVYSKFAFTALLFATMVAAIPSQNSPREAQADGLDGPVGEDFGVLEVVEGLLGDLGV